MASSDASASILKLLQRNELTIDGALSRVWDEKGWRGFSGMALTFMMHLLMVMLVLVTALGGGIAFAVDSFRGTAAAAFFSLLGASLSFSLLGIYLTLAAWAGFHRRKFSPSAEIDPDKRNPRIYMLSLSLMVLDLGLLIAAIIVAILSAALKG